MPPVTIGQVQNADLMDDQGADTGQSDHCGFQRFRGGMMAGLLDFLQSASNSAASNVSAPVDGLAWLLRKAGIDVGEPVGGSDWMQRQGLTRPVKQGAASLAGETAGLLSPMLAAAKAPQIAKGLLSLDDHAMDMARQAVENRMVGGGLLMSAAPESVNNARTAIFNLDGMPNRGRDLIQSKSSELAKRLESMGFKVDLQHSGSAAGPSSYLRIFDPETGRSIPKQIRFSGHSKGAFNSADVWNVASDSEFDAVVNVASEMRKKGKSQGLLFQESLETEARKLIDAGVKPRAAYVQARKILERTGLPIK